jgi:hypothetical protein
MPVYSITKSIKAFSPQIFDKGVTIKRLASLSSIKKIEWE